MARPACRSWLRKPLSRVGRLENRLHDVEDMEGQIGASAGSRRCAPQCQVQRPHAATFRAALGRKLCPIGVRWSVQPLVWRSFVDIFLQTNTEPSKAFGSGKRMAPLVP